MADLTSQIVDSGRYGNSEDPVLTALADTDNEFVNDGKTFLWVANSDASPHTLTVDSVPSEVGREGDVAIVVPAGEERVSSFFRPDLFNKAGGRVTFSVDSITGMSVAIVRMNPGQ